MALFLQLFTFFYTLPWNSAYTNTTLEILDHISIYFLIAGTYTRFTYVYAKFFYYVAIGFVGLTVLGIIYTIFF
jgi:hemolysin III